MKTMRYFGTMICLVGVLSVYAQQMTEQPQASFQSTSTMVGSGSSYTSDVYEVGSSTPNAAPARGPRKTGGPGKPSGESSGYDPNNPQFSPVGDALIPLLFMALAYMFIRIRLRKNNA